MDFLQELVRKMILLKVREEFNKIKDREELEKEKKYELNKQISKKLLRKKLVEKLKEIRRRVRSKALKIQKAKDVSERYEKAKMPLDKKTMYVREIPRKVMAEPLKVSEVPMREAIKTTETIIRENSKQISQQLEEALGGIADYVKDPYVKSLEYDGEKLKIKTIEGNEEVVHLSEEEAKKIVKNFAKLAKVESKQVFETRLENIKISAIISSILGVKFVIEKVE